MRVLVMGSGGVGGYFGGLMARAGHEVTFVARGAHLAAILDRGLLVIDQGERLPIEPTRAVERPADIGVSPDLVLFTVKTYDTGPAAEAIKPIVAANTTVVPLQNGVDAVQEIGAVVGPDRMLGGMTNIGARIAEPGVVERFSPFAAVVIGEPRGGMSERVETIAGAMKAAGIDVQATADIQRSLWEKLMLLAPLAGLTSATNLPSGKVRAAREGKALYLTMMREVMAVGRSSGVNLPDESYTSVEQFFLNLPDTHTTSMQRDFEAQRRVELEHLAGSVVRRGRAVEVPVPNFETVYALLRTKALSFGGVS
ncbi:MAG: 2-dehydropantoate 2-reductase [Chloroflexota bacterium]|nr:2-dehydropantoate 2-reductase [Chloroflexota bacterium]